MPVLLAQCSLPPVLLALVAFVQRRYGPALGGLLAGLPLSSGPVVLFTALHLGGERAARTALTTLEGIGPVCVLCLVYARAARRHGPRRTTAAAVGAFVLAAGALEAVRPGPAVAVPLGIAVLAAVVRRWPAGAAVPAARGGGAPLWTRMLLVTAYVMAVCALTWRLGPDVTGPFAPFPVLVVTQVSRTHRAQGPAAAAAFLRGVLRSEWAFIASFLLLSATLPTQRLPAAVALALAAGAAAHWAASRVGREPR